MALSLALLPCSSFAATLDLTNWSVSATESGDANLNLAIEYVGTDPNIADIEAIDIEVPETDDIEAVITPAAAFPKDVIINEFVSDPETGSAEWIELYNTTDSEIDITDWRIVEGSGKATLLSGTIEAGDYTLVMSPKGSLNNTGDLIHLLDSTNTWIDGVAYGDWDDSTAPAVSDPLSVGLDSDGYFVEMQATPGSTNEILETSSDEADVSIATVDENTDDTDTNETADQYDDNTENSDTESELPACDPTPGDTDVEASDEATVISLANIRSLPLGSKVITEGVVSALPGILGKQFFYLAGSGIQAYMYSADFPALSRGTRVRVSGELSEAGGETRVKLSNLEDIVLLSQEDEPLPHDVGTAEIGEATEGWLVRVTGQVSEIKSDYFMIADDSGETKVVLKSTTGAILSSEVGDELTVTGIVSQTSSGYRLLPRSQDDLLPRTADDDESPIATGMSSSNSGGGMLGWVLSAATMLALAGSAVTYTYKKKRTRGATATA